MNRIHAAIVTIIVGASVAVGGVALRGNEAGGAAPPTQTIAVLDPALAERTASLDALEASIDEQLAATPAPPPTPKVRVVQASSRPAVVRSHDDDSDDRGYEDGEHEGDEGGDDD